MNEELYDVTIVGGGPGGLFSAFYSGLREMKTKIIEYHPFLGGKVNVYPEKMIWDVGGVTPIPAQQLIEQLIQQGLTFEPEVCLSTKVTSIDKNEEGIFLLYTNTGQVHYSKTVIVAIGGGIISPTKLAIEGAERFEVTNLHYTVKSLRQFKNQVVLISGGGNSAVDWANELESIAKKVYLIYRKDELKGHEAEVSKLLESSVECLFNTTIEKFYASDDHERIERVVLLDEKGIEQLLHVDEVIINHGYDREKDLIEKSAIVIDMQDEYSIKGTPMSETSVEGLYAAGDILHHEGKLHLIAGAFQDAANAVNRAKQYIAPDANSFGRVSSHNDLFKERNKELIKKIVSTSL